MNKTSGVLSVNDVMHELSCCRNSAYKYIKAGVFPAKRIDKKWRIPAKPFYDWLNGTA